MATGEASNFHTQLKESFAWEPLLWESVTLFNLKKWWKLLLHNW